MGSRHGKNKAGKEGGEDPEMISKLSLGHMEYCGDAPEITVTPFQGPGPNWATEFGK